jgi:hypothetical protein
MDELAEKIASVLVPYMNDNDGCMSEGDVWRSAKARARSVLSCIEENGMVVVPREPTKEMLAAGAVAEGDGNLEAQAMSLWSAMLNASPALASA